MVYDVAAENGGAISILEYFYMQHKDNKKNHYFYMLSNYHLDETDNITVINVPEVKRGWKERLLFDFFGVKKYLRKFQIDEVFSLQNTIIPCFKGKQIVYEHNALPFSEYRFSIKEDRTMWIYQNIIGRFMLFGIKKADMVIVQTEWMKKAIVQKLPEAEPKIEVHFPKISILNGYLYKRPDECIFFYPANSSSFKNHRLILEACLLLKKKDILDFTVVFTLQGAETEEIKCLYQKGKAEKIKIQWVGNLSREKVFAWYSKSVLVFPSYIETVGLPIYEALSVGCPLLLADCAYSKNVAKDYKDVKYYHYGDANSLAKYMESEIVKCRKNDNKKQLGENL